MSLVELEPPQSEPVDLAQLHMHLRLSHSEEDPLLTRLIVAAREQVELITQRALISRPFRLYLDQLPSEPVVRLPKAPVSSLQSITLYDEDGEPQALSLESLRKDLAANPPRLRLPAHAYTPGKAANGAEIDFLAGYGASTASVPAGLRQAVILLVAFWFERRLGEQEELLCSLRPHGLVEALSPYKVLRL
ncbi:head-tail connector protein [Polycladidibacter hongkongensis]|uniref:head-tail connector protein n=1 Tax=Polycladidibacter hongkongensis TaxID=1647556 RepID=UPI00082C4BB8|nr:hypothetical protein [Pseudovibrio hongkongensis]